MKILIIGSGGREYAIGLKLKSQNHELFFAPGNGGTAELGVNLKISDFYQLARFAKSEGVGLTIVGAEAPLSAGVVDIFKSYDLEIFGPSKAAARLEGSKAFMKEFLAKNGIKTAKFLNTKSEAEAHKFINSLNLPVVVKADGLCAGKGVIIAKTHEEARKAASDMLSGDSFGEAGKRVVVEEFLDGFELSFFAICDGRNFVSLPVAQDHKRLLDNDEGPNTGGMGAYAPSPLAWPELIAQVENEIVAPTLAGMRAEGAPFCGVLFVGLMVVDNEPFVLEFNVRFGDPECEVLMPLIEGDLGEILLNASKGQLSPIKISPKSAVGVVMASENYPFGASGPAKISLTTLPQNTHIAWAGVSKNGEDLIADGGRVAVCVGLADSLQEAQNRAYSLCECVKFKGAKYRKDIAARALG